MNELTFNDWLTIGLLLGIAAGMILVIRYAVRLERILRIRRFERRQEKRYADWQEQHRKDLASYHAQCTKGDKG